MTPGRARDAERFLEDDLAERDLWEFRATLDPATVKRFGELVAAAAAPIDDVRASANYRGHALAVLARRTLTWAWRESTPTTTFTSGRREDGRSRSRCSAGSPRCT